MQSITPRPSPAYYFGQIVTVEVKAIHKGLVAKATTNAVVLGCFLSDFSGFYQKKANFRYFLQQLDLIDGFSQIIPEEDTTFPEAEIVQAVGVYHFSTNKAQYYPAS